MFRNAEVITALFGRVGFKQPTQAAYAVLDTANLKSKSGRTFQDFHAAVTVKNIKETAEDELMDTATFNAYLKQLQESCIASVLDGVFNQPEILEQTLLFDHDFGVPISSAPIALVNKGKFVGFEIKVAPSPIIAVRLNSISLYFDGPASFNLYLFNSAIKEPLKTIPVVTIADSQVIVDLDDVILNHASSNNKSGLFYLGYFQDDLGTVKAYDESRYQWNCGKCFNAYPIEADPVVGQTDFKRVNIAGSGYTYGLNLEVSSFKDYTETIIRNAQLFDKAIGLQMAAMVVERVINSVRSNLTERMTKEATGRLYNDLNLDMATVEMPYSSGLKNQLTRELKRLNSNFFPKHRIQTFTIPDDTCYSQRRIR